MQARLDVALQEKFSGFLADSGLSPSQAARLLLRKALSDGDLRTVVREALVQEGLMLGLSAFKKRLGRLLPQLLEEVGRD